MNGLFSSGLFDSGLAKAPQSAEHVHPEAFQSIDEFSLFSGFNFISYFTIVETNNTKRFQQELLRNDLAF